MGQTAAPSITENENQEAMTRESLEANARKSVALMDQQMANGENVDPQQHLLMKTLSDLEGKTVEVDLQSSGFRVTDVATGEVTELSSETTLTQENENGEGVVISQSGGTINESTLVTIVDNGEPNKAGMGAMMMVAISSITPDAPDVDLVKIASGLRAHEGLQGLDFSTAEGVQQFAEQGLSEISSVKSDLESSGQSLEGSLAVMEGVLTALSDVEGKTVEVNPDNGAVRVTDVASGEVNNLIDGSTISTYALNEDGERELVSQTPGEVDEAGFVTLVENGQADPDAIKQTITEIESRASDQTVVQDAEAAQRVQQETQDQVTRLTTQEQMQQAMGSGGPFGMMIALLIALTSGENPMDAMKDLFNIDKDADPDAPEGGEPDQQDGQENGATNDTEANADGTDQDANEVTNNENTEGTEGSNLTGVNGTAVTIVPTSAALDASVDVDLENGNVNIGNDSASSFFNTLSANDGQQYAMVDATVAQDLGNTSDGMDYENASTYNFGLGSA